MPSSGSHPIRPRLTVFLCFLVALFEGFDIQAAGVAAPKMIGSLGASPAALGMFFSASTVGMLIGAFTGGRLSDRFGRKPVLLVSVALFGLCSILTGLTSAIPLLVAARFATGIGLGGALPAIIALVSETNPQRKGRAVALMYAGTPLGGALAGIASALFDAWQSIFHLGGVLPLAVLPFLATMLRENPRSAGHAVVTAEGRASLARGLFGDGRASATLLLWGTFFLAMLVLYLMLNWTPTLLAARGFTPGLIAVFQATLNVAGSIVVMGAASWLDGGKLRTVTLVAYGMAAVMLGLVAILPANLPAIVLVACLFGGALLTSQSILYASAPRIYPEEIRGTGVGAAIGAGRAGSIVGPLAAALVLSLGATPVMLILATAPVMLLAGALNLLVLRRGS